VTACSTPFWLCALCSCSGYGSLLSSTSSASVSFKDPCAESQLALAAWARQRRPAPDRRRDVQVQAPFAQRDDLGEATYAMNDEEEDESRSSGCFKSRQVGACTTWARGLLRKWESRRSALSDRYSNSRWQPSSSLTVRSRQARGTIFP